MAGIFYQQTSDAGAFAEGMNSGIKTGLAAWQLKKQNELVDIKIKEGNIDLAKKKNIQAAETKIGELSTAYKTEVAEMAKKLPSTSPPSVSTTDQPRRIPIDMSEEAKIASFLDPEGMSGTEMKTTSLQNIAAKNVAAAAKNHEKTLQDYHDALSHKSGKLMGDIRQTYLEHGLVKEAADCLKQQVDAIRKVGTTPGVSPQQTFNLLKGLLSGDLSNATFTEVKNKVGTYKIEKLEGGGVLVLDTTSGTIKATVETPGKKTTKIQNIINGDSEQTTAVTWDAQGNVVKETPLGAAGSRRKGGAGGESGDGRMKGYEVTAIEKNVQRAFLDQALNNVTDEDTKSKITPANAFNYLLPEQRLTYRGVVRQAQSLKQGNKKMTDTDAVQQALGMDYTQSETGGGKHQAVPVRRDLSAGGGKTPKETVTVGSEKFTKVTEDTSGNRWGHKADGSKKLIKRGGVTGNL